MDYRWHDAVRTLAKFHKVNPKSVGLESFGKPTNFYDRQIKTLGTISIAQSKAVDVDTKRAVGKIPHFDELIAFFSNKAQQPKDRGTLVHGDYKIDNMVFHKTEPRVIGILDWEMATVGHPLSDLVNLTGPHSWVLEPKFSGGKNSITGGTGKAQPQFVPGAVAGLPTLEQCVNWYAEEAGWNPGPELAWGTAFGGLRAAVIMQGIAARYALRQASGTTAMQVGELMAPYGEWAYSLVNILQQKADRQEATARL